MHGLCGTPCQSCLERDLCASTVSSATSHLRNYLLYSPMCDEMILTLPAPAAGSDRLRQEVGKYTSQIWVEPDFRKAFDLALERTHPEDVLLVCGSLYLVGPLRTHIRRRLGMTSPCTE